MDYKLTVDKEQLAEYIVKEFDDLAMLVQSGNWDEVSNFLEENPGMVNSTELVSREDRKKHGRQSDLNTPLHHAADKGAPANIFTKLLDLGAYKSVKNANNETPHDIALKKGLEEEILKMLMLPVRVAENQESISLMEAALHKVILGRVEDLIKKNGQSLPQIGRLWEETVGEEEGYSTAWFAVPGMYGGFSLNLNVAENELTADSWCRVAGGSEERHVIDKHGNVTEKHEEVISY